MREDLSQEGRKDDGAKPRYSLLPWEAVAVVVAVLEFGARKYSEGNWRHVEGGSRRYRDAALRHVIADQRGEALDPDSGLPHLAHAACSLLFAIALDRKEG